MTDPETSDCYIAKFVTARGRAWWLAEQPAEDGTHNLHYDRHEAELFDTASECADEIACHAAKYNRPRFPTGHNKVGEEGVWSIIRITYSHTEEEI